MSNFVIYGSFQSVAKGNMLGLPEFRENMGILGIQAAEPFIDRLYRSFDLDQDGFVNFADFAEYMDILKSGDNRSRTYLSFRIIDLNNKKYLTKQDYLTFIGDFLQAWSSITNIPISTHFKYSAR